LQTRVLLQIVGLSRPTKRIIALLFDIALCLLTVAIAYYLRLGEWTLPYRTQFFSYLAAILLAIPLFIRFGLYRAIFRYAGWGALAAVVKACAIYTVVYSAVFFAVGIPGIPRTTGIIQPILLLITVGGSRAIIRFLLDEGQAGFLALNQRRRVIIYGAGSSGRQLAAGLANSHEMQVMGFIDDDLRLAGSSLNGKMIHSSETIQTVLEALDISDILLAIPSASRNMRNEILGRLRGTSVNVRTLPGLMDLAQGKVTVSDLRELDIDDLLGRDAVLPNRELLEKRIVDKAVLVTGAGGSIGSELCRQILKLKPTILLLAEINEYSLYAIHQELEQKRNALDSSQIAVIPLLASVQDEARMESIISTWKPDTIFHAAAYKHVPLVEHNPAQGIRNNVFGTLTTAKIAARNSVADFVLISTDKAVRPTNIMGASKRMAEMVLQALASEGGDTRFSMVRFGNVLGSSGSVVPLFRQQIKSGGPITVTHPEITRYFMTIPEASQLVIQASAMAQGGEVFVLDMGKSVKIVDLAERMIELSGLAVQNLDNPDGDVRIEFVGLRPGEKLYEELLIGDNPEATQHPGIMKANEHFVPHDELMNHLSHLDKILHANATIEILNKLSALVPGYKRNPQAVDWVFLKRSGIQMETLSETPDTTTNA
jgi:FlaA1/EpsC-like NDP-sugar epimerase